MRPPAGRDVSGSFAIRRRCIALAEFSPEKAYSAVKPSEFARQRWFRHKLSHVTDFEILDCAEFESGATADQCLVLGILRFEGAGDYFVPVVAESLLPGSGEKCPKAYGVIKDGSSGKKAVVYDGAFHPMYVNTVLDLIESDATIPAVKGQFRFRKIVSSRAERGWEISQVGDAYTNSVVIVQRRSALKTFRVMTPGINPDVEVGIALATETDFRETPRVQGEVSYVDSCGVEYSVAVQTEEVPNIGDAWELVEIALTEAMKSVAHGLKEGDAKFSDFDGILSADASRRLGATIGRFHQAMASIDAPGFGVRRAGPGDIDMWRRNARARACGALADIRHALDCGLLADDADAAYAAERVLAAEESILEAEERMLWGLAPDLNGAGMVIRCHGDLHLGQILVRPDGSYAILDFEGEPMASLEERRALHSPARDVAGMLRSYSYAANAAMAAARANCEAECLCKLESLVNEWESRARTAFLEGYFGEACSGVGNLLPGDFRARCALVSYFELDKAMYEAGYELNNRPDWVVIPLKGILQIMERWGGNTR